MINATKRTIEIIGVPMDLGQTRRGVDMGPSAVRYAGLNEKIARLGYTVVDRGNLSVPVRDQIAPPPPRNGNGAPLRHLPEIAAVCAELYRLAETALEADLAAPHGESILPIFLGGDHSIAMGTAGGASARDAIGMIWVDAHGDFNTPETTPSGNLHGMPVATLIGNGHSDLVNLGRPGAKLRARDIVMIGIRDLDDAERVALASSGVIVYTMRDIDELGMATVARRALARLNHLQRIHLSFDMDSLDPQFAPGVGTPVTGGITFREAHLLMEILSESGKITSLDVVEVNPILDSSNRTARLAVELIASLLGKGIL